MTTIFQSTTRIALALFALVIVAALAFFIGAEHDAMPKIEFSLSEVTKP